MIKGLIIFFVLISFIPAIPLVYSKYTEWDVADPSDDKTFINEVFLSFTPKIATALVKQGVDLNSSAQIIDVRTEEEFSNSHIKNSVSLPQQELRKKISEVVPDKHGTIYIICGNNFCSSVVTRYLRNIGYDKSFMIDGGLDAWKKAGYDVEEYLY